MVKLVTVFLIMLFFSNTYASFDNPSKLNKNIRNYILNKPSSEIIKNSDRSAFHQSSDKSTYSINDFPSHIYQNFNSTFSFNKNSIYWIAGITGVTLGLISLDSKIDNSVRNLKNDHKWIYTASPIITNFGGNYAAYLSAAYAAYSISTGYKKGQETSVLLLESIVYSTIWTRLGKLVFGRERPSAAYQYPDRPGGKWYGPFLQIKNKRNLSVSSYDAFPSGHTSFAFSIATVFAEQYNSTLYVPVIAYSLATAVGISRTIEHTHWTSDVFVGACIGYFSGKSSIMIYNKNKNNAKQKEIKISLTPDIINNGIGANVVF